MTEPLATLVKECKERGIYWTGGPWCDWVVELTARIEQLEREQRYYEAVTNEYQHQRDEARKEAALWRTDLINTVSRLHRTGEKVNTMPDYRALAWESNHD